MDSLRGNCTKIGLLRWIKVIVQLPTGGATLLMFPCKSCMQILLIIICLMDSLAKVLEPEASNENPAPRTEFSCNYYLNLYKRVLYLYH